MITLCAIALTFTGCKTLRTIMIIPGTDLQIVNNLPKDWVVRVSDGHLPPPQGTGCLLTIASGSSGWYKLPYHPDFAYYSYSYSYVVEYTIRFIAKAYNPAGEYVGVVTLEVPPFSHPGTWVINSYEPRMEPPAKP